MFGGSGLDPSFASVADSVFARNPGERRVSGRGPSGRCGYTNTSPRVLNQGGTVHSGCPLSLSAQGPET
jgi:hypothetical protein